MSDKSSFHSARDHLPPSIHESQSPNNQDTQFAGPDPDVIWIHCQGMGQPQILNISVMRSAQPPVITVAQLREYLTTKFLDYRDIASHRMIIKKHGENVDLPNNTLVTALAGNMFEKPHHAEVREVGKRVLFRECLFSIPYSHCTYEQEPWYAPLASIVQLFRFSSSSATSVSAQEFTITPRVTGRSEQASSAAPLSVSPQTIPPRTNDTTLRYRGNKKSLHL